MVEEVVSGPRPIEGVNTAVAGFIGFTESVRNGAQIGRAMLVTNWTQYLNYFAAPNSDGYTDFNAYLPFAVYGYFNNGGRLCYITSIGTQLPGTSQPTLPPIATVQIPKRGNRPTLNVSLRAEQAAALGTIQIIISDSRPRPMPEGTQGEPPPNTGEYFSLQLRCGDEMLEQYDHLTMNPDAPTQMATYVVEALRSSMYVEVEDEAQPGQPLNRRPMNGQYDLSPPLAITTMTPERFSNDIVGSQDDRTGLRGMFEYDQITMLACPDLMRAHEAGIMDLDRVHAIMHQMINLCDATIDGSTPNPPNRMVVLDSPYNCVKPQQVARWLEQELKIRSMFAALYYPWIRVRNPRNAGRLISVPPCGHMMGVWARTDEERGVHKAPVNEIPRGVVGLDYDVNYREQELLNPIGINCIRRFPNCGIRIWGARTLVDPEVEEWRYINVRRLVSYIEKSIQEGTQWAVFEANDRRLWGKLRRSTTKFLERLWREGALVGKTREEAFSVKCDESNNPPETIKLGRVYMDVKVAPVRPAEFVIFRISQMNYLDLEDEAHLDLENELHWMIGSLD
ncbi:phage tail protein [Chroococcidiopsis cubana CCALA 043]|nr:phage tail protein [Chroococcidiopsis cubana CCALA 043]